MTECLQLSTEVMGTNAGYHANQTGLDLTTRPFLTQHNSATTIQPYDVE
jgi:hypothetical protein